jgi:hypothetical protein
MNRFMRRRITNSFELKKRKKEIEKNKHNNQKAKRDKYNVHHKEKLND